MAALAPPMSPPTAPIRFDFVDFSLVGGGSVIGTLRDGSGVVVDSVEVVVVDVVGGVVLRLIHGGSGRFVVVVVVETRHGRDVVNQAGRSTEWPKPKAVLMRQNPAGHPVLVTGREKIESGEAPTAIKALVSNRYEG